MCSSDRQRRFVEDTASLAKTARRQTKADLRRLMGISDDLARLNVERFKAFDAESTDGVQAAFAFAGDVYEGLKARELDGAGLIEGRTRGVEHPAPMRTVLGFHPFDAFRDGLGGQHHAWAAAKRAVIHGAMAIAGPVAKIHQLNPGQTPIEGAAQDTHLEIRT